MRLLFQYDILLFVRNKRLIILFSILLGITVIVIFSSIIFSVSTITTFGHNINVYQEGRALSDEILDAIDIRGSSIFLLNDERITSEIEYAVPQIQVINIERQFPNRVRIHFVKMYNYFRVYHNGNYYSLRSNGRVTYINEETNKNFINIFAPQNRESFRVGDYMFHGENAEFLREMTASFERLNLRESIASDFFEFINIVYSDNNTYIGIRGGGIIRILGRENFLTKLRLGLSVFVHQSLGSGAIITANATHAFVSNPSDYTQIRNRLNQA